jgi:hypothetical protein
MMTLRRPLRRYLATMLAVGLAAGVLSGCMTSEPKRWSVAANGDNTFLGETRALGLGIVKTYVITDSNRNPKEVGIRLTPATLDGLPKDDPVPMQHIVIDFPEEAKPTIFYHIMMNWYSHGRKPAELFGEPHFAFHFYTVPEAEVHAIDPKGSPAQAGHLLDAQYAPKDFIPEPGPPAEKAVPMMGLHWLDSTREFGPGKDEFKEVFVNGSWDGKLIFLEPLATRKWMLTKPNFSAEIKQPAAYQRDGLYPTTYGIRYDESLNEYVISLSGLTMRRTVQP